MKERQDRDGEKKEIREEGGREGEETGGEKKTDGAKDSADITQAKL